MDYAMQKLTPVIGALVVLGGGMISAEAQTVYNTTRSAFQSISWNLADHWDPQGVPGAGDTITLTEPTEENNVNQGDELGTMINAIGHVTLSGSVAGETGYRFRRGVLHFDNRPAASVLTLTGTGDTVLQFRYDDPGQRVLLRNDLLVAVDNTVGRIDFRGNFSSDQVDRAIIKEGSGELRFRDTLNTEGYRGDIDVKAGVLRFRNAGLTGLRGDNRLTIRDGGQLRLDGQDVLGQDYAYDFGLAVLHLNGFGRAEDYGGSGGALRQHAGVADDIATVANPIVLDTPAAVHVNRSDEIGSTLRLTGDLSGPGILHKAGGGRLHLAGVNTAGGLIVENGAVVLQSGDALANAPLRFTNRDNVRSLSLFGDHTVALLEGDAPDPEEQETTNTLTLNLAGADSVFTVDQAIFFDDESAEDSTRFQGDLAGTGGFVKAGDGMLRFTRWAKTYTGPTTIRQGVLAVSASAGLANTASITVLDGGQLRLTTSGSAVEYAFGGPLTLNGQGRSGGVVAESGQGIAGALRYDPGNEGNSVTLASALLLASDSGVHVAGLDNTLALEGAISGPGTLIKSGGGTLTLAGIHSGAGAVVVENGALLLQGPHTGGGNVLIEAGAEVGGDGSIGGNLTFAANASLWFSATHTLNVAGTVSFGGFGVANLLGLNEGVANGSYRLIEGQINVANLSHRGEPNAYVLADGRLAFFSVGTDALELTVAGDVFEVREEVDGRVTITGYNASGDWVEIPELLGGKPVGGIAENAFAGAQLISVVFPASLTDIEDGAFFGVDSLRRIYFHGDAPNINSDLFSGTPAIIYYRHGTSGWEETFAGRPTALWNAIILSGPGNISIGSEGLRFAVTGPVDHRAIIEFRTAWGAGESTPISTNLLTGGAAVFTDPNWASYGSGYYRVVVPAFKGANP
jgi:autotransporter-associated beta strand protein